MNDEQAYMEWLRNAAFTDITEQVKEMLAQEED